MLNYVQFVTRMLMFNKGVRGDITENGVLFSPGKILLLLGRMTLGSLRNSPNIGIVF